MLETLGALLLAILSVGIIFLILWVFVALDEINKKVDKLLEQKEEK